MPDELTEPQIDATVERYVLELARYERVAEIVADQLRRELRAGQQRHLLSFRAKHPEDLREKLRRNRDDPKYAYVLLARNINDVVTDLAGCRVVVYDPEASKQVDAIVQDRLPHAGRPDDREIHDKPSGYRAIHHLVRLGAGPEMLSVGGAICEIQICSVAAHLFNELEHDIRYKPVATPVGADETELLEQLLSVTHLTDSMVRHLERHRREEVHRRTAPLADPGELRYALEQLAGRPLRGDFVRLYRLLRVVFEPLTSAVLESKGSVRQALQRGETAARDRNLDIVDDVIFFALGIMEVHRLVRQFHAVAQSWRGPDTALKLALLVAQRGPTTESEREAGDE
ncbi:MAG: hypothetical protein HY905_17845 [Deltaproteobacteria bacterium]|nr:hypothetical protein [Deltaproteobacteria bacterium]